MLEIAQRLNTQPWKLVGGTKTLWYARVRAVRAAGFAASHILENRADDMDSIAGKRKRGRR